MKKALMGGAMTGAAVAGAALSLMLVGCWPRQSVVLGDPHRLPAPEQLIVAVPPAVSPGAAPTSIVMQNLSYHVDDDLRIAIRRMSGRVRNVNGGIIVLDDNKDLAFDIGSGEIALTAPALSILLNRYVFGFKGSPLKDLVVRTEGDHIVQTGTMHKLIDIPFEMTATLSVNDDGWIRIHPTKIDICNLDGAKLLSAVGSSLEKLLDLSGGKGVRVVGNDLLLDPLLTLPPPRINARTTGIRVDGANIVQTFGGGAGEAPVLPAPAQNYIYFRGGTIRFGKLYMVDTDLLTIDADESDPFDFYFNYYHTALVAGRSYTTPNYGLIAYLADFDDLGTEKVPTLQRGARPPGDRG